MPKSRDLFQYCDRTCRGPVRYFYRKTEPFGFLSQWYPSGFKDDEKFPGIYFPTAEHYMHYSKAILFGDKETADKILALDADGANGALSIGRQVKKFDSQVWDEHKKTIVFRGNYLKFSSRDAADIREQLMRLKGHWLVDCSPTDAIWGIGYSLEDSKNVSPSKWGKNLLGCILMAVCNAIVKDADNGEPEDSDDEEETTDDSDYESRYVNRSTYTTVQHKDDDAGAKHSKFDHNLSEERDDDMEEDSVDMEDDTARAIPPFPFAKQQNDEQYGSPEPQVDKNDLDQPPATKSATVAAGREEQTNAGNNESVLVTDGDGIRPELRQPTVATNEPQGRLDDAGTAMSASFWSSAVQLLRQSSRVTGLSTGIRGTYRVVKNLRRPNLQTLLSKPRHLMGRSSLPRKLPSLPIRLPRSLTWYRQPMHLQGLKPNTAESTSKGYSGNKQDQITHQLPNKQSEQIKENDGEGDSDWDGVRKKQKTS